MIAFMSSDVMLFLHGERAARVMKLRLSSEGQSVIIERFFIVRIFEAHTSS